MYVSYEITISKKKIRYIHDVLTLYLCRVETSNPFINGQLP